MTPKNPQLFIKAKQAEKMGDFKNLSRKIDKRI